MKNIIAILILTLLFYGCKNEEPLPQLDVEFTSQVLGQFAPCKIKFETPTLGDDYEWSFDGQAENSLVRNPTVTFPTPGTYSITLKVLGNNGGGKTTKTVIVPPAATHFKINTVVLSEYPMLNLSGNTWDPIPYRSPDIYFSILGLKPTFPSLYKHEAKMQDVPVMKNINFIIPGGLLLPVADDNYSLMIYDWDENSYEIMGNIPFNPWYYVTTNGYYPESFLGSQQGCTATFHVTWH